MGVNIACVVWELACIQGRLEKVLRLIFYFNKLY